MRLYLLSELCKSARRKHALRREVRTQTAKQIKTGDESTIDYCREENIGKSRVGRPVLLCSHLDWLGVSALADGRDNTAQIHRGVDQPDV